MPKKSASSSKAKASPPTATNASKPAPTIVKSSSAAKSSGAARKTAAQAVRDFMEANPHLRNRDIVRALAAQGIVVDDTIPAQIRSRDKKGRPDKGADPANGSDSATSAPATSDTAPRKKSRKPEGPTPEEKASDARNKARLQTTVFVHSPVHSQFAHDLLAVRTHSQAVKNLRILIARLERIIVMMEALKEDDWEITLLAQPDGLLFSATHAQSRTAPQVRARLDKLAIQPNEVVLVEVE